MKYRNKFEIDVAKQLKKTGCSFDYESEKILYVRAGHYIPDFIIKTPLGKVYVECKGYFRPEDKAKLIAVKKTNPKIDLRILFYSYSKRNVRWAEKHGFKYAIAEIPEEWLL